VPRVRTLGVVVLVQGNTTEQRHPHKTATQNGLAVRGAGLIRLHADRPTKLIYVAIEEPTMVLRALSARIW
jgi:hypothetical protein